MDSAYTSVIFDEKLIMLSGKKVLNFSLRFVLSLEIGHDVKSTYINGCHIKFYCDHIIAIRKYGVYTFHYITFITFISNR